MPLYLKDDVTARLVVQLAKLRGTTKQNAVNMAVKAELERLGEALPLRDRLLNFWQANPLPPATGEAADKAFFDDLSGDL